MGEATLARQFCIAELATMLIAALKMQAGEVFRDAARSLICHVGGTLAKTHRCVPDLVCDYRGVADDEEAPWPVGGTACGPRVMLLVCLKKLRMLCLLVGCLQDDGFALPWCSLVAVQATAVLQDLALPTPVAAGTRATISVVQRDPWVALVLAARSSA